MRLGSAAASRSADDRRWCQPRTGLLHPLEVGLALGLLRIKRWPKSCDKCLSEGIHVVIEESSRNCVRCRPALHFRQPGRNDPSALR